MNVINDDKLFCYIWKIKNFRMNLKKTGECLISPSFTVKKFRKTKWCLTLYPKRNNDTSSDMSCYLNYLNSSEGLSEITISFNLFLVDNLFQLPKYKDGSSITFKKDNSFGWEKIKFMSTSKQKKTALKNSIYIICYMKLPENKNLSNDITIIKSLVSDSFCIDSLHSNMSSDLFSEECENIREMKKKICHFPNTCIAQTIIITEHKSFTWSVKDISQIKRIHLIASVSESPDFLITLYMDTKINIEVTATELQQKPLKLICKISILNHAGEIQRSIECESIIDISNQCFKMQLEIYDLMENECTLEKSFSHLFCEMFISDGNSISYIDSVPAFDFSNQSSLCNNKSCISAKEFQSKMKNFYSTGLYFDVTLQIRNKTFQVHKAILSINSPVFNAMFANDMKEKSTNVVNISDMDADTLENMLTFMYSNLLENIAIEAAMKLYAASDKYQVTNLQTKCTEYLISNLTVENVCPVLCLGNSHNDARLKRHTSYFILQNFNQILQTEEWKMFEIENLQLANEMLRKMCLNLSRIQID